MIATNVKGDSIESQSGDGAIIITRPDAPINLLEDTSQRTKSTLAVTWEPAAYDGLSAVIDYTISIAEQGGSFSTLTTTTVTNHLIESLDAGTTYEIKI